MKIRSDLRTEDLLSKLQDFWRLSGEKIRLIERDYPDGKGSPVFTVDGNYAAQGWTEWTQGFQFGSSILQFDATDDGSFLEGARQKIISVMSPHLTHTGVHDHGFNNISTYGNLYRLVCENRIPKNEWERNFYELALKVSGAVQAVRWTEIKGGGGFIYSFNGPHSLFVDAIRSVRCLVVSHRLHHYLQGEGDVKVDLLTRAIEHLHATARYSVYYGEGRDAFDVRGRTAHESTFNINNGEYRCPASLQGYSPFTTWMRGLAWAMCGFAEQLEWLSLEGSSYLSEATVSTLTQEFLKAAMATSDFYIANTPSDGVPFWDSDPPGLRELGDWRQQRSDPFNDLEPIDSSAATIASQGLLRLGRYLKGMNDANAARYWTAGLTVVDALLDDPYLSRDAKHQGLILHSVYHRPRAWDHIPKGRKIPCGESSMWGDYHAREVCLYLLRILQGKNYLTYFAG